MVVTATCTTKLYEGEWNDDQQARKSWRTFLTSLPIPEETDGIDYPSPVRRESSYSSSSSDEDCYEILNLYPVDSPVDELHVAQVMESNEEFESNAPAELTPNERPREEYAIVHEVDAIITVCANVIDLPNRIAMHTAETSLGSPVDLPGQLASPCTSRLSPVDNTQPATPISASTHTDRLDEPIGTTHKPTSSSFSHCLSKASAYARVLMKRPLLTLIGQHPSSEPILLHLKSLDGQHTFIDHAVGDTFEPLTSSFHVDLPFTTSLQIPSSYTFYRQRLLKRIQKHFA